jgi:hypothetical protein
MQNLSSLCPLCILRALRVPKLLIRAIRTHKEYHALT